MMQLPDISTVYKVGLTAVVVLAVLWSFCLDRQKPPTVKEFIAKLVARALFLAFLLAITVGFLYLGLSAFRG